PPRRQPRRPQRPGAAAAGSLRLAGGQGAAGAGCRDRAGRRSPGGRCAPARAVRPGGAGAEPRAGLQPPRARRLRPLARFAVRFAAMRILLVEDDKVLADALSRALVQSAHAVDAVATGEAADRALALAEYDLAILDVGLPGLSGMEVLQRLRARKATTPVLRLTALDALEDRA